LANISKSGIIIFSRFNISNYFNKLLHFFWRLYFWLSMLANLTLTFNFRMHGTGNLIDVPYLTSCISMFQVTQAIGIWNRPALN
jgi:hypothetical protein